MIQIYQPQAGKEELKAIKNVFKSNWLGYGRNGTKQDDLATSRFTFLNPCLNYGVKATQIDVDKSFEGKGFMFPSKQSHMVYPFYTSNEYRITVSGNIRLKVK